MISDPAFEVEQPRELEGRTKSANWPGPCQQSSRRHKRCPVGRLERTKWLTPASAECRLLGLPVLLGHFPTQRKPVLASLPVHSPAKSGAIRGPRGPSGCLLALTAKLAFSPAGISEGISRGGDLRNHRCWGDVHPMTDPGFLRRWPTCAVGRLV